MAPEIRIALADDHRIVRDGLRSLIEQEHGLTVVGEADNGRAIIPLVKETLPDVIVLDIGMPDLNGIEAARQLREACPKVRILALSMHSDKRQVSAMLRAGARGYVLKDSAFEEIAQAIRAVAEDRTYLSPTITDVVLDDYVHRVGAEEGSAFSVLSAREREVLQLIAEGQATKGIAALLHISVKTVETHRAQIMEKLSLRTVSELTKYAIREGLTSL